MNVFCHFFNQPMLPSAMQQFAVGLITLTIAIAIFLVEKGVTFHFDRLVILKKIIDGKLFIFSFLFLFTPLFIWDMSDEFVRFLLFGTYVIGIIIFMTFLHHAYKWIAEIETDEKRSQDGYRQKKRLEYLSEIKADPQRLIAWEYLLKIKNKTIAEERAYTEKFIHIINSLQKQKNYKEVDTYLSILNQHVNNLSFHDWVIFEEFFKSFLQWHEELFGLSKEKRENRRVYFPVQAIVKQLIVKSLETGLSVGASYIVFDLLKQKTSKEMHLSNEYINRLMMTIAPVLLDKIPESAESFSIWEDYFPEEWKITKENLEDKENVLAKFWLRYFLQWTQQKIVEDFGKETKTDRNLDEVVEGLFPTIDPRVWSTIVTFLVRPWSDGYRVKGLIDTPRSFGHNPRIMGIELTEVNGSEDSYKQAYQKQSKEIDAQVRNSIELALLLFSDEFTREHLEKYLSEIKSLKYNKDSREEAYRDQIKVIFEEMLKILSKSK